MGIDIKTMQAELERRRKKLEEYQKALERVQQLEKELHGEVVEEKPKHHISKYIPTPKPPRKRIPKYTSKGNRVKDPHNWRYTTPRHRVHCANPYCGRGFLTHRGTLCSQKCREVAYILAGGRGEERKKDLIENKGQLRSRTEWGKILGKTKGDRKQRAQLLSAPQEPQKPDSKPEEPHKDKPVILVKGDPLKSTLTPR